MKAVSLWQPWASLIVHGIKGVETRGYPTNVRGRVAIHATKKGGFDEMCLAAHCELVDQGTTTVQRLIEIGAVIE